MLDLYVGPQPGQPRIGFQSKKSAQRSAAKQQPMAEKRSGLGSYAVPMSDGTWAYWTAHGEHNPGRLLLPAGRAIDGADWTQWGGRWSTGRTVLCDLDHPEMPTPLGLAGRPPWLPRPFCVSSVEMLPWESLR